jgi:hypothetical protein
MIAPLVFTLTIFATVVRKNGDLSIWFIYVDGYNGVSCLGFKVKITLFTDFFYTKAQGQRKCLICILVVINLCLSQTF